MSSTHVGGGGRRIRHGGALSPALLMGAECLPVCVTWAPTLPAVCGPDPFLYRHLTSLSWLELGGVRKGASLVRLTDGLLRGQPRVARKGLRYLK